MQADYTIARAWRRRIQLLMMVSAVSRAPPTRLNPHGFNNIVQQLDDIHFKTTFGLTVREFNDIHNALQLPEPVQTTQRDAVESKTALLMVLAYLWGARQRSLEGQFGWSHSRSSQVIRATCQAIEDCWFKLLDVTSDRHRLLKPRRLDYYAAAIQRKTGYPSFWGAVDGTVWPIAMPMLDQQEVYNGHKRLHALKYQIIATPDGLLFSSEPYNGRHHDGHIVSELQLVRWADVSAKGLDGKQRYLYGNQAYGVSSAIISPFKGNLISSQEECMNHMLSKYRVTVEWGIGMISMQWPRF